MLDAGEGGVGTPSAYTCGFGSALSPVASTSPNVLQETAFCHGEAGSVGPRRVLEVTLEQQLRASLRQIGVDPDRKGKEAMKELVKFMSSLTEPQLGEFVKLMEHPPGPNDVTTVAQVLEATREAQQALVPKKRGRPRKVQSNG
jgi:hypothetical protein